MTLHLHFGGHDLGPFLSLEIERARRNDEIIECWRALLDVGGVTPALAEQAARELEQALSGEGDLSLRDGAVVARMLAAGDCRKGPALQGVEVLTRLPAAAHEQRRLAVVFAATLQQADLAVLSHAMTVAVTQRAGEAPNVVTRGTLLLARGENPADHEDELPAPASGFARVRREVTRDARDPALEYLVEDRQVFEPLPPGVEDGFYCRCLTRDETGARLTLRGFFAGPRALERAEELATASGATRRRMEENPFLRRVDFEFSSPAGQGADDIAALREDVAYVLKRRVVDHPVLGVNMPHYRQIIGAPWLEVTQGGSAEGATARPAAPAPLYPSDLVEREIVREGATRVRWRYVFRLLGVSNFPE